MNKQEAADIQELLHVFGLNYSTYETGTEREELKSWESYAAAERLYKAVEEDTATRLAEAEVRKFEKTLNPGEKVADPRGWVKTVVAKYMENTESFENWLNRNY